MLLNVSTCDLWDTNPATVEVCDLPFRDYAKHRSFAGLCATVRTFESIAPIREMLAEPGNGRVLVIDAGSSLRFAVMGDQLAELAVRNGWVGMVLAGAVRDTETLSVIEIGLKALGTTARRQPLGGGGEKGGPVSIGGASFKPGDWVYADWDAVLSSPIPLHRKAEV